MRLKCRGYVSVKDKKVFTESEIFTKSGKIDPPIYGKYKDCDFVVRTESSDSPIPKIVYLNKKKGGKKRSNELKKMDEYSGYIMHTQKMKNLEETVSVEKFIADLPRIPLPLRKLIFKAKIVARSVMFLYCFSYSLAEKWRYSISYLLVTFLLSSHK